MMKEYRCQCGKLLFKANTIKISFDDFQTQSRIIETKCNRCGHINSLTLENEVVVPETFKMFA